MHKVLIVEDDRTTNDMLKELVLSIANTEVVQAYDRSSAEQQLRSESFSLLVADVKLGENPKERLSGFTLLRVLGERPTVAIIVSGMPEDMLPDMAISLQAFDFLSKPINDLDFINTVEHALEAYDKLMRESPPGPTNRAWPIELTQDSKRKLHLKWKGKQVLLTLTELRLVHSLLETPDTVVPYAKLAQQLKTPNNNPKTIATHMTGVRRRFVDVDEGFGAIDSEPGRGYVWRTTSA